MYWKRKCHKQQMHNDDNGDYGDDNENNNECN